jgi:hypothetical protein
LILIALISQILRFIKKAMMDGGVVISHISIPILVTKDTREVFQAISNNGTE